jgi:quercetin dioxygenase-like cupin family protein
MTRFDGVADLGPQLIWEGVTARAVHGERLTLALVELEPDSVVPEHAHDNEQVGIMVEGSFEMRAGGETRELRRGDTWSIPPGEPHAVRVGPEGAVVVEVWVPGRDDWNTIERRPPSEPRAFASG